MVRFLLIVVLMLAVLVLIGFVVGYNKIRAADVRVAEALSGIDVELTRRASLIPSLVHTVQTFAAHEKGILDHVTNARAALTSATTGKSVSQRSAAEKELDTALGAGAGARPELPAAQLVEQLPEPAGQPGRHREQTGLRPPVLQRRGGHAEPAAQHHPVDVRRPLAGVSEREYYQTPAIGELPTLAGARIVFAGTPEPALPSLRRLIESTRHDVIAVLTRPDAASGGGAARAVAGGPAGARARHPGAAAHAPQLRRVRRRTDRAGAGLLRGGGLRGAAVRAAARGAPHGWVNLHFSLLPAWRGAAPVQAAIAAGDAVTGATTFQIEPSLDSGPVYGVVTETIRPPTPRGPAGAAVDLGRGTAGDDPRRHRRRHR